MIFHISYPTKLRSLSLLCSSMLVLTACSSEYSASDISISDQGAFVERGTDDKLDGVVVVEKNTGERLSVEFDDGMPNGDVEMQNSEGDVILRTSFVAKEEQRSGAGFMNEVLENSGPSLGTNDYLNLFEEFSEYDGDYLEIDSKNKKTQGHYDRGEKIDRWQVYCENKQLQSDRTFVRKSDDDGKAALIKVSDELVNNCNGDVLLSANRDKQGRLQGSYIENDNGAWVRAADSTDKPLPKYQRNYTDGEFDGDQKEFDRYGLIKIENSYEKGVKQGVEKIYSSSQNYQTKAKEHWLAEVKNYTNGQLNGRYTRFDKEKQPLESGQYKDDKAVGVWTVVNYSKHTQNLVDYDAGNFILEKAKAFKQACFLPKSVWGGTVSWASNSQGDLTNCEYYVENNVVDINKKLALDVQGEFKKSSDWTYAAVVAAPKTYAYMKKHGLKTQVSDSRGRTRLHSCLTQLRAQNKRYPRCSADQAIEYMGDVDINHVSNTGTALHQLSLARNYSSRRPVVVNAELKIAKALIEQGADVDRVNHQKKSPLMTALGNREYGLAELFLDAGASVSGVDINGKSALTYFFLDSRNRWLKSKVSAQGTRVLAKMIALGVDTDATVFNSKTVRDLSEENNTLQHIQTIKDAKAMSSQFKDALTGKMKERQAARPALAQEELSSANENSVVSESQSIDREVTQVAEITNAQAPQVNQASDAIESNGIESDALQQGTNSIEQSANSNLTESNATSGGLLGAVEPAKQVLDNSQPSNNESGQQAGDDRAQQLLKEQAEFLVVQAREHIANLRLQTPKSNSAVGSLEQLKRIDPQSPSIAEIEKAIGEKYLSLASSKMKQGDKAGAQRHLTSAGGFIRDKTQLNEYQARVDSVQAKPARPAAKSQAVNRAVEPVAQKVDIACNPTVQVIGVPLLGRTLIARQSLSMSKQEILRKSMPWIQSDYINIQPRKNGISFQQATKRKPLKIELEVMRDGKFTQLSLISKTPPGLVVKKSAYKNTFCELLATF